MRRHVDHATRSNGDRVCVVGTAVGGTPALLAEGRVGRLFRRRSARARDGDPRAIAGQPAAAGFAEAGRQEGLRIQQRDNGRRYEREYGQPEQPRGTAVAKLRPAGDGGSP